MTHALRSSGRTRIQAHHACTARAKCHNFVSIHPQTLAVGSSVRTVDRVHLSLLDLTVALIVGALLLSALRHCAGCNAGRVAPTVVASRTLTPGLLNPEVTQATIDSTICVHGWTKTVRPPSSYTSEVKAEQMAAYRLTGSPSDYQEDHLVS